MSLRLITRTFRGVCSRAKIEMDLKKEHEELLKKEKLLEKELEKWDGDMAKKEMDLLHTYNEVKDAAQIILSAIAKIEGVTVKKIHERFDLPLGSSGKVAFLRSFEKRARGLTIVMKIIASLSDYTNFNFVTG